MPSQSRTELPAPASAEAGPEAVPETGAAHSARSATMPLPNRSSSPKGSSIDLSASVRASDSAVLLTMPFMIRRVSGSTKQTKERSGETSP